jgi:hypothetical protein
VRLPKLAVLALLSLGACHAGAITRASNDPLSADGAPPAVPVGDASFGGPAIGDDGAAHCAEDIHTAVPVPLDLMLLIDLRADHPARHPRSATAARHSSSSNGRSRGGASGLLEEVARLAEGIEGRCGNQRGSTASEVVPILRAWM